MRSRPTSRGAELVAAVAFLVERQDADGLWRDYALPPGPSDAWTTSVVGLALAPFPAAAAAVARARTAVASLRRPDGWGYNAATACDADSTSFALRFVGGDPAPLARFLDRRARAHTFVGARFGSWSWAHADVTATVGLALDGAAAHAVRDAVLRRREADGLWRSFWWTTDAYAIARTLELLGRTGGIPAGVCMDARDWLERRPAAETAFEAAHLLTVASLCGAPTHAHAEGLRAFRCGDGGWPESPVLLTPSQADGSPGPPHPDVNRLLTTAAAVQALADDSAQASSRYR